MKSLDALDPVAWAERVNQTWIVHSNLNNCAEDWLRHLAALDDERLVRSCEIARAMCEVRGRLDDPKPWFYAGLFHLATVDEVETFLPNHRVTRATIPCMADDESVHLWLDRITPETRALLDRLRSELAKIERG
ncbi:MAG: hypothetical protein V4640_04070 [Verrucomicrobiota bacterium]